MQNQEGKDENKRTIITYNPEETIWYYLSKLTRLDYVIKQLKLRVSEQFFGLPIEEIIAAKKNYNERLSDKNSSTEIYTPISDDLTIRANAQAIIHTATQAIEIYKASQIVSMYAKPILLYYCYVRLAKILFLATYRQDFKKARKSKSHGLTMKSKAGVVICQPAGFFPRFQDSYYPDPSIYLDDTTFRWEDLLVPATQRFYLFDNISIPRSDYQKNILGRKKLLGENKVLVNRFTSETSNPTCIIHELARELMFVFCMSHLARYDVIAWKKLIDSITMWKIEGYLASTQYFFPNLIFNEFHGIEHFFYPESRSAPDEPTF
jgi:hypothetical protein